MATMRVGHHSPLIRRLFSGFFGGCRSGRLSQKEHIWVGVVTTPSFIGFLLRERERISAVYSPGACSSASAEGLLQRLQQSEQHMW